MNKVEQIKLERKKIERKIYLNVMKNIKEGEKFLFLFENDIDIDNEWYKEGIYLYGEQVVYEVLNELIKQKQYNLKRVVIEGEKPSFQYDKIIVSKYLIEGNSDIYTIENCYGEEFANMELSEDYLEWDKKVEEDYDDFDFNFDFEPLNLNEEIEILINELLNNNQVLKLDLEIK